MKLSRRSFTLLAASSIAMPAFAASDPRWYFGGENIAASGADVVAYFGLTRGDAVMGNAAFSTEHKGTTFHFANAENLETFKSDPDKYAPRYGGYCAFAMSRGYFASADPDAWTVHDGALYLNYSKTIRARWAVSRSSNIETGNENWVGFYPGER
ncbi:YHS domain-containing (seleno)protein [Planktotalea sp.]|uniref:YHS domain-containing (seleno)protein n=1 Tax=Planktotalea sp. TaxID=2029877 RepID=UPI0032992C55